MAALFACILGQSALAGVTATSKGPEPASSANQPGATRHLLVVVIDDLAPLECFSDFTGFTESSGGGVSSTSALYAETPVLDGLAANGLRFFSFRTGPLCSPTRASLITGRHAFRHGVGTQILPNVDGPVGQGGLAEFGDAEFAAPSIVQTLAGVGVRTGIIGKIHLSTWTNQEFSKNPGHFGSGWQILNRFAAPNTFLRTQLRNLNQIPVPNSSHQNDGGYYNYFSNATTGNTTLEIRDQYATSWQVDRAIEFFQSLGSNQRGFCLLFLNACHSPYGKRGNPPNLWRDFPPTGMCATQEYIDSLEEASSEGLDTTWPQYMASLEAVDIELGRLFASLPGKIRKGLSTLVIGDNGVEPAIKDGHLQWGKDYGPDWNRLLEEDGSRLKGSVYHWGSSTYAIWSGPGRNEPILPTAGTSTWAMVSDVDIAATASDYFGFSFAPSDGISFLPLAYGEVSGANHPRKETLSESFWPCGDWRKISTGNEPSEKLTRSYHRWLDAASFSNGTGGRFSLVRTFTGGSWHDELYRLNESDGTPVDLFEFDNLLLLGGFEEQHDRMLEDLDLLLDSEL
jgi:arylsulfatase A-like enzyme